MAQDARQAVLASVFEQGEAYGSAVPNSGQKILVEFVSANPTGSGQLEWDPRLDDLGVKLTSGSPDAGQPIPALSELWKAGAQDDQQLLLVPVARCR